MSAGCAGVVFSGPSLPRAAVEAAGFIWRPPARKGDITAALALRPAAIGLIDGVFETERTVWHDEILGAMAQGVRVYGAASIGALRAAELDMYGMIGVGAIYEAYRDGLLEDDAAVAVLHGPEEMGFAPLTVPLVEAYCSRAGHCDPSVGNEKRWPAPNALFYKDIRHLRADSDAGRQVADGAKRNDAFRLLTAMLAKTGSTC